MLEISKNEQISLGKAFARLHDALLGVARPGGLAYKH